MSVIRFPVKADFSKPPTLTWWQEFRLWLARPPKAPVFQIKNPTHWKLTRVRNERRQAPRGTTPGDAA